MKYFVVLFFISINVMVNAQFAPCSCPNEGNGVNQNPIKSFKFKNGKEIVVCGYSDTTNMQITFNEFCLKHCDADTCLISASAMNSSTFKFVKDTLYAQEISDIPIGKNFNRVWQEFFITKYYWKKNKLMDSVYFNN